MWFFFIRAISPFPTKFSAISENFPPFSSNLKLSSAFSFSFEESKICRLRQGEIRYDTSVKINYYLPYQFTEEIREQLRKSDRWVCFYLIAGHSLLLSLSDSLIMWWKRQISHASETVVCYHKSPYNVYMCFTRRIQCELFSIKSINSTVICTFSPNCQPRSDQNNHYSSTCLFVSLYVCIYIGKIGSAPLKTFDREISSSVYLLCA